MTIDQVLPASISQDASATPDSAAGGAFSGSAARADELISFLREYTDERVNSSLMDDRRSVTPGAIMDLGKAGTTRSV